MGAPEMVLADADPTTRSAPGSTQLDELAASGSCCSPAPARAARTARRCPPTLEPVALVMFEEKIRPDAADTLRYFEEQGVALKVISGDNPRTVAAVARPRRAARCRRRPSTPASCPRTSRRWPTMLEAHSVFGRVTPQQKRAIVARAAVARATSSR